MTMRVILAFFLGLVLVSVGSAADTAGGARNSQPIQIKSNYLTTDRAKMTAVFTGKVVARQADVVIYCDRMVIYYSEEEKDVDKVEAFGNVRIIQGNRRGFSGHGIYENKAGKIILDDNPKVYQDEDEVSGKVITYFVETQQSEVTSDPDTRVIAIIHPKQKGNDKNARP